MLNGGGGLERLGLLGELSRVVAKLTVAPEVVVALLGTLRAPYTRL